MHATEIKLTRKYYQAKYTIGRLYANNHFFSDCLEPSSLYLTERSVLGIILIAKYRGYRATSTGCYRILITRSRWFGRWLLLLMNVKGFERIRIRAGNKSEDTRGYILLGFNRRKEYVLDSTRCVLTLVKMITETIAKGEKVFVEVRQSPTHSLTPNPSPKGEEGASPSAPFRREGEVISEIPLKFYSRVKGGNCELCE